MKLVGKHTSLTETASDLLKFLKKVEGVEKVSPGYIVNKPSKSSLNTSRKVVFHTERYGLLATVTGRSSIQELRIYGAFESEVLISKVEEEFKKKQWLISTRN